MIYDMVYSYLSIIHAGPIHHTSNDLYEILCNVVLEFNILIGSDLLFHGCALTLLSYYPGVSLPIWADFVQGARFKVNSAVVCSVGVW